MAIIRYPEIVVVICFIFLCFWKLFSSVIWAAAKTESRSTPTNWPVIGMIPGLLGNVHRIHEFASEVLQENGCTFALKGPWFSSMDMLVTCDPANIHHVLSKNFSNYPKGPKFNEKFDILGDGIFNADSELWEFHRKTTMSLISNAKFLNLLETTNWGKLEKGLVPVLDHVSELGLQVDLQDLLQRFSYDTICILALGYDPSSLCIDGAPSDNVFSDAEEAFLYRHILPESYWKLQRWLQIGIEKKLSKGAETIDHFLAHCISLKRQQLLENQEEEEDFDCLLTAFMQVCKENNSDKFLRDTLLSLVFAGRDTTSVALTWFFWLVARNPLVETKIREEMRTKLHLKKDEKWSFSFNAKELSSLVYLHGALCEALRLFAPVPVQHKTTLEPDILPSGHRVDSNAKIAFSFYTVGRMESIWGKDCLEFKPERWISERGGEIKHVPSFKFVAFNAGPRSCLGKQMAFIQMKIVATTVIHNYHVQPVEGHPISPSNSVVLTMKHGFKVKVTKRSGVGDPSIG